MLSRRRSRWQRRPIALLAGSVVLVVSILLIWAGYRFQWNWTGFIQPAKTLWDWLQLLGVLALPGAVVLATAWFTTRQGQLSDAEQRDNQREAALQAYIDTLSELLLAKNLRHSTEDEEVQKIAQARTLTVLRRLDAERKGSVLQFLHESTLLGKERRIIDLTGADLSRAHLSGADLSGADLSGANLSRANLSGADLSEANLSEANLGGADLSGTNLSGADLNEANLIGANLSGADLIGANLTEADLIGAFLIGAFLSRANLSGTSLGEANLGGADLRGVFLGGADLSGANLSRALVTLEQLTPTKSLQGATMPDGSKHS